MRRKSAKSSKSEALPELIVDGFDTEQIWQQLELENNEEFGRSSLGKFSKTLMNKKSWVLPLKIHREQNADQKESEASDAEIEEAEASDADSEEADDVLSEKLDNSRNEDDKIRPKTLKSTRRKRTTKVDDKFFKLDELDEFLQKEDKREMSERKRRDDSSDEDNESIDLFKNFSESDSDDEKKDLGEDEIKNGKSVKYADFFDSPMSDEEQDYSQDRQNDDDYDDGDDDDRRFNDEVSDDDEEKKIQKELQKDKKKVKFNLLENSDESDSGDNFPNKDDDNEDNPNTKSSLEARQERLKERIKKLEEEAISEKPWQLKGEASALNRPENSLLEEFVEFDSVSRPAPIITEQTTMKLEDIIRKRIQDKAWDDVEKKFKPVETPMEYKKKLILNQDKGIDKCSSIYLFLTYFIHRFILLVRRVRSRNTRLQRLQEFIPLTFTTR